MRERVRFWFWALRYTWPLLCDLAETLREWRRQRAYMLRYGWNARRMR